MHSIAGKSNLLKDLSSNCDEHKDFADDNYKTCKDRCHAGPVSSFMVISEPEAAKHVLRATDNPSKPLYDKGLVREVSHTSCSYHVAKSRKLSRSSSFSSTRKC